MFAVSREDSVEGDAGLEVEAATDESPTLDIPPSHSKTISDGSEAKANLTTTPVSSLSLADSDSSVDSASKTGGAIPRGFASSTTSNSLSDTPVSDAEDASSTFVAFELTSATSCPKVEETR